MRGRAFCALAGTPLLLDCLSARTAVVSGRFLAARRITVIIGGRGENNRHLRGPEVDSVQREVLIEGDVGEGRPGASCKASSLVFRGLAELG